jgi:outer membrane protein insertion porin family
VPSLAVLALLAISEIVVEGNRKTTSSTVREISDLRVGDPWTESRRRHAEDELITSGLFRSVEVDDETTATGVRVVLRVRDKHSWLVAPTFYWQPTNRGGGLGFGENNLFGRNEKLLLYAQAATGDSFFIGAFIDPSWRGGSWRWQADVYLRTARVIEYSSPRAWRDDPVPVRQSRLQYLNVGGKLGKELSEGAVLEGRLRGAHVSFSDVALADGATLEDVGAAPGDEVPAPGAPGWDLSAEVLATLDARVNTWGLVEGGRAQMTWEHTLPGSDFRYSYVGLGLQQGFVFGPSHNLIAELILGVGEDMPFQQEYSIGGTQHRGLENGQLRGDLRALANLEYSVPVISHRGVALRALGFVDAGYAGFFDIEPDDGRFRHYLPGADAGGAAPYKTSVGLGTRVFLRQVVLPLLGLDFGYGVERRDFEIYLAIGLVD